MAEKQSVDKETKKKQSNAFEGILERTMSEMITELAEVNKEASTSLQSCISGMSTRKLFRELQKPESEVVRLIPKTYLERYVGGRRYLDVLSLIQPTLKPTVVTKQTKKKMKQKPTVAAAPVVVGNEIAQSSPPSQGVVLDDNFNPFLQLPDLPEGATMPGMPPEMMKGLLSAVKNIGAKQSKDSNLMKLMKSAMTELNLKDKKPEDMTNISGMMSMMTDFNEFLERKKESNEIDMTKFEEEAKELVEQLQESPEIKKLMNDPQFASMAQMASGMSEGGMGLGDIASMASSFM